MRYDSDPCSVKQLDFETTNFAKFSLVSITNLEAEILIRREAFSGPLESPAIPTVIPRSRPRGTGSDE